ncbi:MAG: alpha/beta hydrolase [Thermoactinospora sp.]|nr:alpha/beta hydrolase [Thermoactinospora sp.]
MRISEAEDRADSFVPHAFEEHIVDLGEVRMNHVAEGDPAAPALLLVSAQGESWWGYEQAIPLLTSHFRVFAVDLRGQGRSTWTPGRYTLDNFGNDLVRFIDLVIERPVVVAGNSSGGLVATWLAAFAKPGQIRGAVLEDPPLFSAQAAPPYGHGMRQTMGPMFDAWAKWLGDQWSVGDWEGMIEALPRELPPALVPAAAFMLGDGESPSAGPPQHLKEYDPEWARAWSTDLANAGCDHQAMLERVRVPVLMTHHLRMTDPDSGHLVGALSDLQARRVREIIEAAGQRVDYVSLPEAPHVMHEADPARYAKLVGDWAGALD